MPVQMKVDQPFEIPAMMSPSFMAYDALLVKHCASVMASIRPANLFVFHHKETDPFNLEIVLNHFVKEFEGTKLSIHILCRCEHYALIYLYAPDRLWSWLNKRDHLQFLNLNGYDVLGIEAVRYGSKMDQLLAMRRLLNALKKRLEINHRCKQSFPHEIGIFLGYPYEDVVGFLQQGAKKALCSGYWKVYQDPYRKRQIFDHIRKWEGYFQSAVLSGYRPSVLVRSSSEICVQ